MYQSTLRVLCLLALPLIFTPNAVAQTAEFDAIRNHVGQAISLKRKAYTAKKGAATLSESDAETKARNFLKSRKELGLPAGLELNNTPTRRDKSSGYTRVRITQSHKNVPVWGGSAIVNLDAAGEVVYASSSISKNLPNSVKPKLAKGQARRIAVKDASLRFYGVNASVKSIELWVLPARSINAFASDQDYLAWRVVVEGFSSSQSRTYFIDAGSKSGEILDSYSNIEHLDRHIKDCATYPFDFTCYIDEEGQDGYFHGRSETAPQRGPNNRTDFIQYGSTDVDEAWETVAGVHQFTFDTLGLNGANNVGGTRNRSGEQTQTHVGVHSEGAPDGSLDPACPDIVGYLNTSDHNIWICLDEVDHDTVAHEYAHSITNWSFFVGIPPDILTLGTDSNHPHTRALNESRSDVYAALYEMSPPPDGLGASDWKAVSTTRGVLRDIVSPNDSPTPHAHRTYGAYFRCSTDEPDPVVRAYRNSTVFSHAFYLLVEGGEFNGCEVAAQGSQVGNKIYDTAWRDYFLSNQTFSDVYTKFILACEQEYGAGSTECLEFSKALQAVEVDQLEAPFGGGKCVDPLGADGEQPPACAVKNLEAVNAAWPDGSDATLFAPGEQIFAEGSSGRTGKSVDIHLVDAVADRPIWDDIEAASQAVTTATVDANGEVVADLVTASTEGEFDILVDGNQDGVYQPWADTYQTITVQTPVGGDELCYAGQSYATSENCNDSPQDCGCAPGYYCRGRYVQSEIQYSCARRRRGCFVAGTQITLSNGKTKAIEKIQIGDKVKSIDPRTGEFIEGTVKNFFPRTGEEFVILNSTTKVTPDHRFYVPKQGPGLSMVSLGSPVLKEVERAGGKWVPIGQIKVGTMLLSAKGELIEVKSLERVTETHPVYNFHVFPEPNYIANGIVVHNRKPNIKVADYDIPQ